MNRHDADSSIDHHTAATVCLCPKCGGQKHVNKPPYIAGDQPMWVANNTGGFTCPVCNGRGWIYA